MAFWARALNDQSDEALVAAVAHGDAQAFTQLSERQGTKVLALAQAPLHSPADAVDSPQEVLTLPWHQAGHW